MTDALITAIVFLSIVSVIKILADARTRNKIIEQGIPDENLKRYLEATTEKHALSSLKWGMVLLGIGLAALISQAFPHYIEEEVGFGLILVFAGLAFLIYYPLAEKRLSRTRERQNSHAQ
jgi:uncharacterized membrane protein